MFKTLPCVCWRNFSITDNFALYHNQLTINGCTIWHQFKQITLEYTVLKQSHYKLTDIRYMQTSI